MHTQYAVVLPALTRLDCSSAAAPLPTVVKRKVSSSISVLQGNEAQATWSKAARAYIQGPCYLQTPYRDTPTPHWQPSWGTKKGTKSQFVAPTPASLMPHDGTDTFIQTAVHWQPPASQTNTQHKTSGKQHPFSLTKHPTSQQQGTHAPTK